MAEHSEMRQGVATFAGEEKVSGFWFLVSGLWFLGTCALNGGSRAKPKQTEVLVSDSKYKVLTSNL